MFGNTEDVGFVICSKCGARIRADREWCLRCHEPLVAWKKPEIPLPSWVRALGGGTLIFGVVGIAAIAVIFYLSVDSDPSRVDQPTRPVLSNAASAVRTAVKAPASTHIEQVTFIDAPRRGSVDVAESNLAAARTQLEEALQHDPKDPVTLNNLGLTLERLGFVDSAVGRFSEAVALDRRNWIYHFNLAHAMSLRQDWPHAASEYAAALEIFPDNYAAQYNMAVAYHLSSNETAATKAFEKAIQMAPGDPTAHLSYALTLEASSRSDEAVSEYRTYLQMVPTARDAAAVDARIHALSHDS